MKNYQEVQINTTIKNAKDFKEINVKHISDGHHTFGDLYERSAYLFAVILKLNPKQSFRSKKHDDGTMFNGDFVAGINTPDGQYTFHYKIKDYWHLFDGVKTLDRAPKYDGHQPEDIDRLFSLVKSIGKGKNNEQK